MKDQIVKIRYWNGLVYAKKWSRIKVYRYMGGSIKGFLKDFDEQRDMLIIKEPSNFNLFDQNKVSGHIRELPVKNLKGFAFYPEVSYMIDSNIDINIDREGAKIK